MKNLSIDQMEVIEGGFPWGSFAAGVACGVGILTAETGIGIAIAYASCGTAFISD